MSQHIQDLLAQANAAAEESGIDMNEAVSGGGGRLLPQGWAYAQLVEYIELGQQPQEFGGKPKDPALEFQLGWALSGTAPDPANPGQFLSYSNDDGSPYIMRPYPIAQLRNDKAGAYKLFKLLNYKGIAKNFGQLLSQKYLVQIVHVPKSKTDPKIVARIKADSFQPPVVQAGPQAGMAYDIKDADPSLYRLFTWNKPTLEGWKSLFIEGMYEAKDGKPAASKNRVQETILSALDFEGSPLQLLLAQNGVSVTVPKKAAVQPVAGPGVVAAPAVTPAAVAPVVAAPAAVVAPVVAAPVVAAPVVAQVVAPVIAAAPVLPA